MPAIVDTVARILFHADQAALRDVARAQADWLPFYREHGRAMSVDVRYLEQIGGPQPIEMLLHIGSLHQFVFNADWREFPDVIAGGVCQLRPCAPRNIDWTDLQDPKLELDTNGFMHKLAHKVDDDQHTLVFVDTAADCFDLAVVKSSEVSALADALNESDEATLHVVRDTEFPD